MTDRYEKIHKAMAAALTTYDQSKTDNLIEEKACG